MCMLAAGAEFPRTQQPRRAMLLSAAALLLAPALRAYAAADVPPAAIDLSRTPDQRSYDAGDPELRAAANALQKALNATTVDEEERLWTELIGLPPPPHLSRSGPPCRSTQYLRCLQRSTEV